MEEEVQEHFQLEKVHQLAESSRELIETSVLENDDAVTVVHVNSRC
jgi:hypothetical protein